MDLSALIKSFPTTPFLFVGSGFSRRYYGLPDWSGLMKVFVKRLSDDEFAFNSYMQRAKNDHPGIIDANLMPYVASLLEVDFNERWFSDASFRCLKEQYLEFAKQGHSPFKTEICQYIKDNSIVVEEKRKELELLNSISSRSLSGIITTNYVELLENETDGFTAYVGQEELIFSAIQGWAEIYKIHGSVTSPDSIVITQRDYENFEENCPYLAAKLMTIFMEYPIIFLGYSVSDHNVSMILKSLVKCLSDENLEKLQDRFIYVEWARDKTEVEISPSYITINDRTIRVTAVKTDNFEAIFHALSGKRSTLPTKVLRLFKQEFYTYALTSQPTSNIRVADIDDTRVGDNELILAIGKPSTFGLRGLRGITSEEWYRNIIMQDLEFTADEILEYAYPELLKKNNKLPLYMLLRQAKNEYPQLREDNTFDDLLSCTIKNTRDKKFISHRSVNGILNDNKDDVPKAIYLISHLYENEIDVNELETFLVSCFSEPRFYGSLESFVRSNFNRLVRIYDYMKYGRIIK